MKNASTTQTFRRLITQNIILPLLLTTILCGVFVLQIQSLLSVNRMLSYSDKVIVLANDTMKNITDCETGVRGYLLNGAISFLEPYQKGLPRVMPALETMETLVSDNPVQMERIKTIRELFVTWLKLSEVRVDAKSFKKPLLVDAERAKMVMDGIREHFSSVLATANTLRAKRLDEVDVATRNSLTITLILSVITGAFLAYFGRKQLMSLSKTYEETLDIQTKQNKSLKEQEWLNRGQAELLDAIRGEISVPEISRRTLQFLAHFLDAQVGSLYTSNFTKSSNAVFQRTAGFAIDQWDHQSTSSRTHFRKGETLLGQAVEENTVLILNDVPPGYLSISSSLGAMTPNHLVLAPFVSDSRAIGAIELGFVNPPPAAVRTLLLRISEPLGVLVQSAMMRVQQTDLLEETQKLNENLQTQQEELRVANEELAEQARTLQESQVKLSSQQAELEQTNEELEEQARVLENQKDLVDRRNDELVDAQKNLRRQAEELEKGSKYKSEFLANMSHELRTPLNSTLILAKLLADNSSGNLEQEQVKFAETIYSSGNDLLQLINDILDLSKVEAGHLELNPEVISIPRLCSTLTTLFGPIAGQKKIEFKVDVDPGLKANLNTDSLRLEQILKNFLSNAFKFTPHGSVSLKIFRPASEKGKIAFTVRDSGIGISPDHQEVIFEAFRQADGTTNRKYGGTGLGLSISMQLARLLGGKISVESEPNKGSAFTLVVPEEFSFGGPTPSPFIPGTDQTEKAKDPWAGTASAQNGASDTSEPGQASSPIIPSKAFGEDDRARPPGSRKILVIEDDVTFAHILFDIAHELQFDCLVAESAQEGLELAMTHSPDAVILDMKLPDYSGLWVLDRLKAQPETRHIPVHIVSGHNNVQAALHKGAIGHLHKPVSRENLVNVFNQLRDKFTRQKKKVLIVEDDTVQSESLKRLIGDPDTEVVTAATGRDVLELVQKETWDCLIVDLGLPDMTGFELLDQISQQDIGSYPPIIVYTGKSLNREQEEKLRKYSQSVIIKGAKSPERLLDEVSLFLHRVESRMPPDRQKLLKTYREREKIFEGRVILVADDDARNIFALTSALEHSGAKVEIARNGREAIQKLESKPEIDLVLMDVMMPEMDGLEATREIRRRSEWKRLPIIAVTAKAMKDDHDRCLEAGANDYLPKPIDLTKLLALIRVWMPMAGRLG